MPNGGQIINLSSMDKITGMDRDDEGYILHVQPGAILQTVNGAIDSRRFDDSLWDDNSKNTLKEFKRDKPHFFSPDPTETTASIGGMIACNSSGARSFRYGPVRDHLEYIGVILAGGDGIKLKRERDRAKEDSFTLETEQGRIIEGSIPSYEFPGLKNASGYYSKKNMDMIDLFCGSEGTLGVIYEAGIRLIKKPGFTMGILFFFTREDNALIFTRIARDGKIDPVAVEYFDEGALRLLREYRSGSVRIKDFDKNYRACVYLEFDSDDEGDIYDRMVMAGKEALTLGSKENRAAVSPWMMDSMRSFRHRIPEICNGIIDDRKKTDVRITKLGTDMAVFDEDFFDTMEMYREDTKKGGFETCIFGHIGDNHVHVNILPRNMDEYERGRELYTRWAEIVSKKGGSVSAEHGIGKLKTKYLEMMYGMDNINEMKRIKELFDPRICLNRGNLFEV